MKIHCPFKGCDGTIDLNESLRRFAMGGDARFFINAKDLDHSYKGVEMTAEEFTELTDAIDTELNVFYPDGVTERDITKEHIEKWLAEFRDQKDEERAESVQDASNRKGFFTCPVCYNVVGNIQLEPGLYNVMCATETDEGRSVLFDTSDKAHEKHISLSVDEVPDKYLKPWARSMEAWKAVKAKKKVKKTCLDCESPDECFGCHNHDKYKKRVR